MFDVVAKMAPNFGILEEYYNVRKSYKLRSSFIAYLLFSFCAIQFSTIHIHHKQTGENESSHSHQLEVHLYQANLHNSSEKSNHDHPDSVNSIDVEYDSTLLNILKHLSDFNDLHFWYAVNNVTNSVIKKRLHNVVIHNKNNFIPYLRSQAPPVV